MNHTGLAAVLAVLAGLAGGLATVPARADDPPELAALRKQREMALQQIQQEADARRQTLDRQYQKALDDLYRRFVLQNNLGGAAATLKVRREAFPASPPPAEGTTPGAIAAAPMPGKFSWSKAKEGLTYRYKTKQFARRAYDYSDPSETKLLDGVAKEVAYEGTVAWEGAKTARLCFEFVMPVKPTQFRIHVLGGKPEATYRAPKSIVVLEGSRADAGREIGAARDIKDRTDWVEIPIDAGRPVQFFWVEIERGDSLLLCIDEVEFR